MSRSSPISLTYFFLMLLLLSLLPPPSFLLPRSAFPFLPYLPDLCFPCPPMPRTDSFTRRARLSYFRPLWVLLTKLSLVQPAYVHRTFQTHNCTLHSICLPHEGPQLSPVGASPHTSTGSRIAHISSASYPSGLPTKVPSGPVRIRPPDTK